MLPRTPQNLTLKLMIFAARGELVRSAQRPIQRAKPYQIFDRTRRGLRPGAAVPQWDMRTGTVMCRIK